MPPERRLDEAAVEKRRERILETKTHCGAVVGDQAGWRDPLPRRSVTRAQAPDGGRVMSAPPRLRQHLLGDEQADLDAHAGEADALPSHLGGRGHVVVPGEVAPAHPAAVVQHGQRALAGIHRDRQRSRVRVDGVGDDLGQDGLLGSARIGVAEIFEEVQEIDAGLAHALSHRLRTCPAHHGASLYRIPSHGAGAGLELSR